MSTKAACLHIACLYGFYSKQEMKKKGQKGVMKETCYVTMRLCLMCALAGRTGQICKVPGCGGWPVTLDHCCIDLQMEGPNLLSNIVFRCQ